MSTPLDFTVKYGLNHSRKILVELDADKWEKLAADFGFFNPEFLESLDRAEKDDNFGRIKKINSLKELRK